jgi:hypothetical protein
MAKLCRFCEKLAAEHGGVCGSCRRRILKNPAAPMPCAGVWQLAGLLIGLLIITSGLIAGAVVTHHASLLLLPWTDHFSPESRLSSGNPPVIYETAIVIEQATRKVYPYSIVPGGALNLDEARRAMNQPSVKATYANFNFAQLREVKLRKNLSGYISYRWGEKIYWTSAMLTVGIGETVFTDGVNLVRGRCLNFYSPYPMLPIRPDEPTEKVLDTPVEMPVIAYSFAKLPVEIPELPPPLKELTPTVPILPAVPPSTAGNTGAGMWFSLVPVIPPIHRRPPQQLVITPEPNFQ